MTDQSRAPLVVITQGLTVAKEDIIELLGDTQYSSIRLYLVNSIETMINRVNFLTGTAPNVSVVDKFPPVTNFMGEEITIPKKIIPEDLEPEALETELFLQKVNSLFLSIDTIPADGILNTYTLPEDQLVVRGVAKRAGVEDYEERPINVAFIDDIVEAIHQSKVKGQQEEQIEKELAAQKKLAELTPKLEDARKTGAILSEQLKASEEELTKAKEGAQKTNAQRKVDHLKMQVESNLADQIDLEHDIDTLKSGTDAATGKQ